MHNFMDTQHHAQHWPAPRVPGTLQVDVTINLVERKSGGLGAGGGLAHGGGLGFVGNATYTEKNLFGLNQKLSAQVELGQVDKMFQVIHTDPWLFRDKHRTSRTISLMNNRSSGFLILGPADAPAPMDEPGAAPADAPSAIADMMAAPSAGQPGDVLLGRLVGGRWSWG